MRDDENRSRRLDTVLMYFEFSELTWSKENSYFKLRVERVNLIFCFHQWYCLVGDIAQTQICGFVIQSVISFRRVFRIGESKNSFKSKFAFSEGSSRNSFEFQFHLHGGRNTCYLVGLFVYVSYSIYKWKCVIWASVQHMTSDTTYKARSVTHASQHGPPSVLRPASEKDSLFLPTWMSPQRRRRFRKLSSRIRKSFRAAKRWKSSFRVRRRSSTFRVSNMLPNILLWWWR